MRELFKTTEGRFGFKDEKGRVVIPPTYDFALPFSEGVAVVCINGKMGQGKTGFIDEYGNIVIDFLYDGARSFCEGLAQVELNKNGKRTTGFINHAGQLAIPMVYNFAMSFRKGLAPVCVGESWVTGKFGCIDKSNQLVIPLEYDYLEPICGDYFVFKSQGHWGIIDSGQNIISPIFKSQRELINYLTPIVR